LEQLLERASDAAFVLDPLEDRFLAANPTGYTMLGYTLDELLATPVSQIHPGELPQLQDFMSGVLRDGHGSTIALTCRTRSGDRLPTEMTLWAFGEGGDRRYLLALIRDRSEHRAGGLRD
jgi:PAS domain S-box-containing protein